MMLNVVKMREPGSDMRHSRSTGMWALIEERFG